MTSSSDNNENPIFILGMPRSGTTLVASILSNHPSVAIAPESHFVCHDWRIFGHKTISDEKNLNRFWKNFVGGWFFKDLDVNDHDVYAKIADIKDVSYKSIFRILLMEYAAKKGKPRWGEKSPGNYMHIDTLLEWYSGARIVFMVRDPRAVVSSLLQTPWSNRYVSFHALRWKKCSEIMTKWGDDEQVLIVSYEDIVQHPVETTKNICDHIGEEYYESMLFDRKDTFPSTRDDWRNEHLEKSKDEIFGSSVYKWKDLLTCYEVSIIELINKKKMIELGYCVGTEKVSIKTKLGYWFERVICRIHIGLSRRIRYLGLLVTIRMVEKRGR